MKTALKTSVLLGSALLALMGTTPSRAQEATFQNGVYQTGFGQTGFGAETPNLNDLRHETGYRLDQNDLSQSYVLDPVAKAVFAKAAPLRSSMDAGMPAIFAPVIQDVQAFIDKMDKDRGHSNAKTNGLSNWYLAVKITRLAFCFGTDPHGVAAQIKVESSFDRTRVSRTGAVGFTQMTGSAIDEVNDQLGNRGNQGARIENTPYLKAAIHCYTGGQAFTPMFQDRTIPAGKLVSGNPALLKAAKRWLRASVDRDLIYGQVMLKILLAHATDNGITGINAYKDAFIRYNGEPSGGARDYSREIVSTMQKI